MKQLIIFDWDGVFILGTDKAYFKCYHLAAKSVGVNLSSEEVRKRVLAKWGKTVKEELAELLKEHPDLVDKAVKNYEQILMGDTFVDCLKAVKGSQKLIKDLSKKYRLAIASGVNPRLLKEKIFPKFGFEDVFSEIMTVYDIDDPSKAKPHPFLVEEIMRRLNVTPNSTVLVGDSKGDVNMAKAAGVTPVVVLTGHLNKLEAKKLGVKFIIKKVTDLETILEEIND